MADLATLSIKVDASGASSALEQLGAKLGQTEKQATTLTSVMGRLGIALSAGLIFKKFIDETSEAQYSVAQLEARIKSTAGAAGQSSAQLQAYASELQNMTTYTDDAVMGAQAMLLTFNKIRGETFPAATLAVMDLAAAMGTDLKGAAIQVGKALQDPAQGLAALRRSGVSFSESQQTIIKSLFDTGKVAEAQRLIIAELQVQFGGAAEAMRNTFGGALAGLKIQLGELFELTTQSTQGVVDFLKTLTAATVTINTHIDDLKGLAAGVAFVGAAYKGAALLSATSSAIMAAAAATVYGGQIAGLGSIRVLLLGIGPLMTAFGAAAVAALGPISLAIAGVLAGYIAYKTLISDVADAEEAAELEARDRTNAVLRGFRDRARERKKLAEVEQAAADARAAQIQAEIDANKAFLKSKEDDAAATRREIEYAGENFVAISALILQKEKLLKINAAIAAATVPIELPKIDIGNLGLPDPGKYLTEWQQTQEIAQQSQEALAQFRREQDAKDKASRAKTAKELSADEIKQLKEVADIRENFVKQFQQTLSTGIASILENGLSSFRSFFDSIKSMFLKLVADFAAAKIMDKMMGKSTAGATSFGMMLGGEGGGALGTASAAAAGGLIGYGVGGMTRNTSLGALGGAASGAATGAMIAGPMGALVGGLAGLVGGFLGASNAAKKFAAEMVQQQNTLMAAAQAFVDRGLTGQAEIESKQNKLAKERDDLLKALEANFKAGGFGTGGAANYQRTVEEIGFAYDRQKKALEETTKAVEQQIVAQEAAAVAAEAFNASLTAMDLDARRLAATGFNEQSAATSLFTRQAREYAQAVKDGWSIEQLINLQEVQALEALSAAAKKTSKDVIYSANSLAAMAEQVVEVSAAWQKTIDGLSEARNAAEQTSNAIRKTVDATRTLFDTLSGYMKSLLVGTLSPLTKSQQVAEARSQFEDAARKAAFGDLEAGGKVTGLANTFLQLMKETSQVSAQAAQDAALATARAAQEALPKYFRQTVENLPAIEGTQTAEYQRAFADVSAMIDAATLGVGGQLDIQVQQLRQAELQTSILTRMLAQANAAARGLPFFAHGGDHSGGMAIVGERGPELINTGRARIFSAADSAAAFAGNSTATVEELRRVIARLETLVRVTAAGAQETVKAVARVSNDVASLTREVRLSGEAAA